MVAPGNKVRIKLSVNRRRVAGERVSFRRFRCRQRCQPWTVVNVYRVECGQNEHEAMDAEGVFCYGGKAFAAVYAIPWFGLELTVMPRMVLSPSDVYMVPTTSITFELFRVEQKQKDDWDETKTKVVLPDATYEPKPRFSVAVIDPGVVTLSDDGTVVADTLGSTRIVVNDALIQFGEHERSKQPGQTYPYCSLL